MALHALVGQLADHAANVLDDAGLDAFGRLVEDQQLGAGRQGAGNRELLLLAAEGEMAILLVEQYYDFARSLADHYLVMERGEIIARGEGADMEKNGVRQLLAV